ncbi:MAG: S8 family serine peptidase, partial [Candidatus Kaelpia imicola]|nr:S8 family serine peptidase [Candidatus Kaelpia imicola]
MKNKGMKTKVFLAAGVLVMLGCGLLLKFNSNSRDAGLTQADKIMEELSSMPSIDNAEVAFKGEEFQEEKKVIIASKPKTKKESYVFSSVDVSEEPGYIDDLRYSGIEVKERKEMTSVSKLVSRHMEKEGFPRMEKSFAKELPDNFVAGDVIVQRVVWAEGGEYKVIYDTLKVAEGQELETIGILEGDPDIVAAEVNAVVKVELDRLLKVQSMPGEQSSRGIIKVQGYRTTDYNDPGLTNQWGLTRIEALDAWNIEEGKDTVKIVVLDSGCRLDHPDLAANINLAESYDYVDSDNIPEDELGHGTRVAGIIAAVGGNGLGGSGVMRKGNLIIYRIICDGDSSVDMATFITAISDAICTGAKIINLSLGIEEEAIMNLNAATSLAMAAAFSNENVLFVAAAGNDTDGGILYPAQYSEVLCVAATDINDGRYAGAAYGDKVDLSAPGVRIYSTTMSLSDEYGYRGGTSMAAGFVSGVAGLLLSKDPGLSTSRLKEILTDSADKFATDAEGRGSGRLNANKALLNANEALLKIASGDTPLEITVSPLEPIVNQPVIFTVDLASAGIDPAASTFNWLFDDGVATI